MLMVGNPFIREFRGKRSRLDRPGSKNPWGNGFCLKLWESRRARLAGFWSLTFVVTCNVLGYSSADRPEFFEQRPIE
jgi:hypothetical protein